jgi:hypothetical protein
MLTFDCTFRREKFFQSSVFFILSSAVTSVSTINRGVPALTMTPREIEATTS